MQPLRDLVFIIPDGDDVSPGGIHLPSFDEDQTFRTHRTATVMAAGPGKRDPKTGKLIPPNVTGGERILINKRDGQTFEYEGISYLAILQKDILAILDYEDSAS